MFEILLFALIPAAVLITAGAVTLRRVPSRPVLSACQHFAAGVVTAAVALELLPTMLKAGSLLAMVAGYLLGLGTMLLIKRFAERLGGVAPVGVDLFIDGLLLAIGFAAGEQGGVILLLGLTLETLSLGLATAPSLARSGMSGGRVLAILAALGGAILTGALAGSALPTDSAVLLSFILGFGVSALLYLVVEELMTEAHEVEDSVPTTAMFFLGFLIPLVLGQMDLFTK